MQFIFTLNNQDIIIIVFMKLLLLPVIILHFIFIYVHILQSFFEVFIFWGLLCTSIVSKVIKLLSHLEGISAQIDLPEVLYLFTSYFCFQWANLLRANWEVYNKDGDVVSESRVTHWPCVSLSLRKREKWKYFCTINSIYFFKIGLISNFWLLIGSIW